MSFGTYARHVRNPELPYRRRVSALRSCVQLYRPIGFHATLSFLEEIAGPFQRDEAALLRALDALVASRAGWHAELRDYAAERKLAKRRGQRNPRPTDPNPSGFPRCWYGAPRQAALHAVRYWRRRTAPALLADPDSITLDVDACVTASLAAGGSLLPAQRQMLGATVEALRQRMRPEMWRDDSRAYYRAFNLLRVARHLETAADAT
ncbi:hypothetical protein [Plantactinospora sp. KLBMP9567]|uniref:hypothetical protein n=1 Tax=Plantactinospora sp. KLBMP9567 TaxID=3085900 RepID=UPI0029811BFE|nr:hypothetical protein [Plantactinospora sp. KLBMP9567]MDW5327248.1 hypothetical protein [Plantactinospora sp. KLBMP9567]